MRSWLRSVLLPTSTTLVLSQACALICVTLRKPSEAIERRTAVSRYPNHQNPSLININPLALRARMPTIIALQC